MKKFETKYAFAGLDPNRQNAKFMRLCVLLCGTALAFCFVLGVTGRASTVTYNQTGEHGAQINITAAWDSTVGGGTVAWTGTANGYDGGSGLNSEGWIYGMVVWDYDSGTVLQSIEAPGAEYGSTVATISGSASGLSALVAGHPHASFLIYGQLQNQAGTFISGDTVNLPLRAQYYVKFDIPANPQPIDPNTGQPALVYINYFFFQDGNQVGAYLQPGGAAATTYIVGPLDSPDPVTMNQALGPVQRNPNTLAPIYGPNTPLGPSTSGTPTQSPNPTSSGGPSSSPLPPTPTNPTSPGAPISAPVLPPTPVLNPPLNPTNPGGSGGSGGATEADIFQLDADIIMGLNGVNTQSQQNAASIVTAVNSASSQAVTSANGIITAVNQTTVAVDKVTTQVQLSNADLDKLVKSLDVTAAQGTANDLGTSLGSAVAGNISTAQSQGTTLGTTIGATDFVTGGTSLAAWNPGPGDDGWATAPYTVDSTHSPVLNGVSAGTVDTNFITSAPLQKITGMGTHLLLVTWIRNFISWSLLVGFMVYTAAEVKKACYALGQTQQMQLPGSTALLAQTSVVGNSVGVAPAFILYGIQVVAISTLILSAPVIIVSALDGVGGFGPAITAVTSNPQGGSGLGTFLSHAFSYANLIFPIPLAITCFANQLLIQFQGVIQWAVNIVVLRILSA